MESFNPDLCNKVQTDLNQKIDKLFECKDAHDKRLAQIEISFARFGEIPQVLKDIHRDLRRLAEMKPKVEDHEFWVGKVKWAVLWISVIAVGGGLAAVTFKGITSLLGLEL